LTWVLIVIMWVVFAAMAVSMLLIKRYRSNQVLGTTLSESHAQHPEVKKILGAFTASCYGILAAFMALSLLLLTPPVKDYAEFYLILVVIFDLFANWFAVEHYRKKLLRLKAQNNWVYPQKSQITVDLNIAREKGKYSVSPFWVWLFFALSFLPTAVLAFREDLRQIYPVGFSLLGPLCQLAVVYIYYRMRSTPSQIIADNPETNLLYARGQERLNSIAATVTALAILVFWIVFQLAVLYAKKGSLFIVPVVLLPVALICTAVWHQGKSRRLANRFLSQLPEDKKYLREEPGTWKRGFYNNPNDPRIFVPKRIASLGWTINIGRPLGKAAIFALFIPLIACFALILYGGVKDYHITLRENEIVIDAAMYDFSVDKADVVSISMTERLPGGRRTNGYGGAAKSYGNFYLEGYGNCKLYIYNDIKQYIVLELAGDNPSYVILNGKTPDETSRLYQDINYWLD
jgi:uncharacterized membrane protein